MKLMWLWIKYFGIWLSLFKVFGLLKTERGLAQKMTEKQAIALMDKIIILASPALELMTFSLLTRERPHYSIGLNKNGQQMIQILFWQMLRWYHGWWMNATRITKGNIFHCSQLKNICSCFNQKRSKQKITWSTNIFTPLYHLSPEHKTMPLWVDKSVWKYMLESDCEFDQRDLHNSIDKHPNDSEKNLAVL